MVCNDGCDLDADFNCGDALVGIIQGRIALGSFLTVLLANQCIFTPNHVSYDLCEQFFEIDNLIILNPLTSELLSGQIHFGRFFLNLLNKYLVRCGRKWGRVVNFR